MNINLDLNSADDYRLFIKIKSLPIYKFVGRQAIIPDEYAQWLGLEKPKPIGARYRPIPGLFDYQEAVSVLAIRKRKFAIFMGCGLGKTLCEMEFARHCNNQLWGRKRTLIVCPYMVVDQTIEEVKRFYANQDDMVVTKVRARELNDWICRTGTEIGITNYEALTDETPQGRLGCLIIDESSSLKSAYGKHGQNVIRLGKGLDFKLALTGTPAPNDRIEYANHAVFLDAFPTVNAFLSRYFVNRGKTGEKWEIKPHAVGSFYKDLSHWCIFLNNPATYGWQDNIDTIPPINIHIHEVPMTASQTGKQRELTGTLFACDPGGIGKRSKLAKIAKTGDSLKPRYIHDLVDSWPDESTLIWCKFNEEQERLNKEILNSISIRGTTPMERRQELIHAFQNGAAKSLISKDKILGFGLNLQIATRQIFSTMHDSFESYHQCIKRSNRIGSTKPLNVHIPITDVEHPMMENVLRKADRVEADTVIQEEIFRENFLSYHR